MSGADATSSGIDKATHDAHIARRGYTLFVLVVVFTSSHVDRQIMGILGQPIKEALLLSDTQLGLLTGFVFALFYATLGMPMALWADRRNRRNLIAFAVFTWSFMTAACAFAQNFTQLLLARIGVGVGEAGSNPPSHSIIADLYPPTERATAMAIFGTGINWGILIGFGVGGWINEWYGWQAAFLLVGLPGLAIAALVRFTVREPPRGLSDVGVSQAPTPPFFQETLRWLLRQRTLLHVIACSTLTAFVGYASIIWVPTYLVRIHDLGTGATGTYLALLIGIGGAAGIYAAGRVADALSARRGPGWGVWLVGAVAIATLPPLAAAFLADNAQSALLWYALPAALGTVYVAPTFAIIQNLTPPAMRAVVASINLFILNIVGLGLGPFTVGWLSDQFAPSYGDASLRYALLCSLVFVLWSAGHAWRAGVLLQRAHRAG
ncbi:MAG: MFS transporter [Pseudomonadota bacterium]